MSKRVIAIVAIIAAIGALLAALYFVQKIEPAGDGGSSAITPSDSVYVLGGADSPAAAVVEVKNEFGSYVLENTKPHEPKNGNNFVIRGYEGVAFNSYSVMGVADRAQALVVASVVAESGANLADFGLDRPSVGVNVTYADNSKATLHIGNAAPGGDGYYAMREGDPAVYLLYQSSAEYFLKSPLDMVELGIVSGDPQSSTFTKAVLGGSVRPEEILVQAVPPQNTSASDGASSVMSFTTHTIEAPIKSRLHAMHGLEPLSSVFGLQGTKAVAKIDSPSDLSAWGLAEPYSTLLIDTEEEGSFKLLASKPDAEGNCYLMREGAPLVYLVPASSLPWLELTPFKMMDKMLILPFIDSVKSVRLETPGKTSVFELEGVDDALAAKLDGQPYENMANFRRFYQTLLAASYDAYTEEPLPANPKLLLQYTYTYRDGRPADTVRFYEGPSRKVFLQLGEDTPMLGLSSYVDRVLADLEKVLAGQDVQSYL